MAEQAINSSTRSNTTGFDGAAKTAATNPGVQLRPKDELFEQLVEAIQNKLEKNHASVAKSLLVGHGRVSWRVAENGKVTISLDVRL